MSSSKLNDRRLLCLVFLKKVDWISDKNLCELDSEKLELVLLDRIETRNKAEYQYLMMLLESKVPKYTIYSEKIEIEKQLGEKIGGIPIGYKLEKIKKYVIRAYQEENNKKIKDIEQVDNLSRNEFEEKALKLIHQYIESVTKKNNPYTYEDIFKRVKAVIAEQSEMNPEEIDEEFEVFTWQEVLDGYFTNPYYKPEDPYSLRRIPVFTTAWGDDNLDIVEFVMALEEELEIDISDEEAEDLQSLRTLKAIVDYIVQKIM
jgi:acyl carrier protein